MVDEHLNVIIKLYKNINNVNVYYRKNRDIF